MDEYANSCTSVSTPRFHQLLKFSKETVQLLYRVNQWNWDSFWRAIGKLFEVQTLQDCKKVVSRILGKKGEGLPSQPPTNSPSMKTWGTVRVPVIPWRVSWISPPSSASIRSLSGSAMKSSQCQKIELACPCLLGFLWVVPMIWHSCWIRGSLEPFSIGYGICVWRFACTY